jgi:glycosyltransferase involved in cell wall biosynthesis
LLTVLHWPVYGGAHNQALRLAGPLGDRGVDTVAVIPDEGGAESDAVERLRDGGVETLIVPLSRLRASLNPVVQARFARALRPDIARLSELIRRFDIDVVQAHGVTNPHGAIAANREAAALVWQLFDTRAPMPLRRLGMPLVTRLADAMTTWGDGVARAHPGADRLGERRITVFPPVDCASLRPQPELRLEARRRLGVPEGSALVATVGVRNSHKGHEWLVRAAELVRQRQPDAVFRVIGAPSPAHAAHERAVREEASRRGLGDPEVFAMVDPGRDVPLLLQAIDVFAMTSPPRSEGMPTAILEAMACGKAVVTTDVGATRELVDDGSTGLIVPPEDPAAIGDAILGLVGNERRREEMGAAGRRDAIKRFDLTVLADRHRRAYDLAIAHRRECRR